MRGPLSVLPIGTVDDPRVEPYRAVRERDLAGRGGRFVAEGDVVVRMLLSDRSRFPVESVLVAESRLPALERMLAEVPGEVPVFVAPRDVMSAIAGFPIHRGLLAIGLRRSGPADVLPPPEAAGLVLGLIGIANHDNVGGAFRNAAAFGADAVLLDETSCDPLYRKAIRVSVGTCLAVPFRHGGSAAALVRQLTAAGFAAIALTPRGLGTVDATAWPRRTALLVGSEGEGLPSSLLETLPGVRIGMAPGLDSLNVATASGIALHAVRTAREAEAGR